MLQLFSRHLKNQELSPPSCLLLSTLPISTIYQHLSRPHSRPTFTVSPTHSPLFTSSIHILNLHHHPCPLLLTSTPVLTLPYLLRDILVHVPFRSPILRLMILILEPPQSNFSWLHHNFLHYISVSPLHHSFLRYISVSPVTSNSHSHPFHSFATSTPYSFNYFEAQSFHELIIWWLHCTIG